LPKRSRHRNSATKLTVANSFNATDFRFPMPPLVFNKLSVHSCKRIDEVLVVISSEVAIHKMAMLYNLDLSISTPIIRNNCASGSNIELNQW
jgi:hypothetical protein